MVWTLKDSLADGHMITVSLIFILLIFANFNTGFALHPTYGIPVEGSDF